MITKINSIKTYYAAQAITKPKRPVVHIQTSQAAKIEIGKISIGPRGRIINIKA